MNVREIDNLILKYGDVKLSDIKKILMKSTPHSCTKCSGKGTILENTIPFDYSGGGMITRMEYVRCDLCNGNGYTEHKYETKVKEYVYREVS